MLSSTFRWVKKILIIVWLISMVFIGAWFAFDNPNKISPILFGTALPNLSLGVYLVGTLIIGILLGASLSFLGAQGRVFRVTRERRALSKEVQRLEADRAQNTGD